MVFPPTGYDDQTVVPVQRVKFLLGELEKELTKVQSVFQQHHFGEFQMQPKVERELSLLQLSAQELGSDYQFLIDKLLLDYEHFHAQPDQEKLDQIFKDMHTLQLLLIG